MQALAKHGEFYKLDNLHGILFESTLDHQVGIGSQIFSEVENLHIEKKNNIECLLKQFVESGPIHPTLGDKKGLNCQLPLKHKNIQTQI